MLKKWSSTKPGVLLTKLFAMALIALHIASCTHLPSGQKAFNSFDECMAANIGLAGLGGLGAGLLTAAITKSVTGNKKAATAAGIAVGVASALGIGLSAWKKCAAVYSTSEPIVTQATPAQVQARRNPGLNLDTVAVAVEGKDDTPPTPTFQFSYAAQDAATKDIKAQFRHKVEIVRFKAQADESVVIVDSQDRPIMEDGEAVLLYNAHKIKRDRLAWVAIAEEGKDDYVEDVVIQQGNSQKFRHKLMLPSREQLPLPIPVPMRYGVTVDVAGQKVAKSVDFLILPSEDRPKVYTASGAAIRTASAAPAAPAAPTPPAEAPKREALVATAPVAAPPAAPNVPAPSSTDNSSFGGTHKMKRKVYLFSDTTPQRKPVIQVNVNAVVKVIERVDVPGNPRPMTWVKLATAQGAIGWVQVSEIAELK
jgi:hypothetical protein